MQSIREIPKIQKNIPWTIISIAESEKILQFAKTSVAALPNGTHHHIWQLADTCQANFLGERLEELLQVLDTTILQHQHPCLVHCAMGISRSTALCVAWLLASATTPTTLAQSLAQVRRVRPSVQPNLGLLAALRALEQSGGNVRLARERMKGHGVGNKERAHS